MLRWPTKLPPRRPAGGVPNPAETSAVPAAADGRPAFVTSVSKAPAFTASILLLAGALAPAVLLLVGRMQRYWPFLLDDTYITLRYARHLAEGWGPVWNVTGPKAEGYTSLLWTVLLAVPHVLHRDGLTFAKLFGAVMAVALVPGVGALAFGASRRLGRGPAVVAAASAMLLYAAVPSVALHGVSGMETSLFAALTTLTVAAAAFAERAPHRRNVALFAVTGLVTALARPEGNLVFAVLAVALLARVPREARRRALGTLGAVYVLPAAAYFLWRTAYFGHLLPLPFHVKATGQGAFFAGLGEGLAFLRGPFREEPLVGAAAILGVLVGGRALVPGVAVFGALFAFFLVPAPIMAMEGRYLQPLVPLLAIAAGVGLAALGAAAGAVARRVAGALARPAGGPWLPSAVAAVAAACVTVTTVRRSEAGLAANVAEWVGYADGVARCHAPLGLALRELRPLARRPLVALMDVGAVGYLSGWDVLDTYGLNDAHVALHGRDDAGYVLDHGPELVVVVSQSDAELRVHFAYEQALHDAAVARGYERVAVYTFLPDYHLLVLAAPGSAVGARLRDQQEGREVATNEP